MTSNSSSTAGNSSSSTSSSELNAGEEDTALSLVMERFNFYRKEYKRVVVYICGKKTHLDF